MKKRFLNLFLLLLLLGAGASLSLFFMLPSASSKSDTKISATSPQAQALVNKHLMMTAHTQDLLQKKLELENSYGRLQVGDSIWPMKSDNVKSYGIDHSADRNEHSVYEDLNRDRKEYQLANPEQIIQGQLADQEKKEKYAEDYRAEYAKQFVENARRAGYQILLNSDYVVIQVVPIPKPNGRVPSMVGQPLRPQAQ